MENTFSHKYLFRFPSFPYDGCKHPPLGGLSEGQLDINTVRSRRSLLLLSRVIRVLLCVTP